MLTSMQWEGMAASLLQVLTEGGPIGLLYGFIVTAIAMVVVASVISELARYNVPSIGLAKANNGSIWPSNGAQYHWIAELSPPKFRTLLVSIDVSFRAKGRMLIKNLVVVWRMDDICLHLAGNSFLCDRSRRSSSGIRDDC